MAYIGILLFSVFITACNGGSLTIHHTPNSLKFNPANTLRSSALDDIMAVSMGYTPETTPWPGLSVLNPFKAPKALLVVAIDASGVELPLEGQGYTLQEDISFTKVVDVLNFTVHSNAMRPIQFRHMEVAQFANVANTALPSAESLLANKEPDSSFLLEAGALPNMVKNLGSDSSVSHGGQDFIFLQVQSFSLLVKTCGDDSPQIREAKKLLSDSITRLSDNAVKFYDGRVLVMSVVMDKTAATLSRRIRAADNGNMTDLNLAKEYSVDYPAVFNIILILSIVLFIIVLATSVAMAYMDPGRDSIIYRMTNPRMKKDQ